MPVKYKTEDGFNLGKWVSRAKYDYKSGRMSEERRNLMRKLEYIELVITGIFILGFISYIMYYLIEKVELKYNFKR